jgi:hypothetical protein
MSGGLTMGRVTVALKRLVLAILASLALSGESTGGLSLHTHPTVR